MSRPSAAAEQLAELRRLVNRDIEVDNGELARLEGLIAGVRARMTASREMLDRLGPAPEVKTRKRKAAPEGGLPV